MNFKTVNMKKVKVGRILFKFTFIIVISNIHIYAQENQKKTTISVYGLRSIDIPQSLAEILQEHLESKLMMFDQYDVLSRNNIDLIFKENRFQQTGVCSEEECLAEAGHLLGIEKIITGTVSRLGLIYNIVLKLIDVRTAKLESSVSRKYSGEPDSLLNIIEVSLFHLLEEDENPASIDTSEKSQMNNDSLELNTQSVDTSYYQTVKQFPNNNDSDSVKTYTKNNKVTTEKNKVNTKKSKLIGFGALGILGAIAISMIISNLTTN